MEEELFMEGIHKNYIKTKELNRIRALEKARKNESIFKKMLRKLDEFFEKYEDTPVENAIFELSQLIFLAGLAFLLVVLGCKTYY